MRAVVQRVSRAAVEVGGDTISKIGRGYLVLLGIARDDSDRDVDFIAQRIIALRIFADSAGKMNLALEAVAGELLVVSQFTLHADTSSGRRPSFVGAAPAEVARQLYESFIDKCRAQGINVMTGEFGSEMKVHLINDGPVTILLDSRRTPI
jgi:D-tyrosyl-tRNA(Tyr) deacylase